MTYKEFLTNKMTELAQNEKVYFLGYNTKYGHQFNGTLVNVPQEKLIEMPVAENLIMGVGIGMALEGYRPVICLERMDFLWACADAVVNHLDKAKALGWPPLNVIIRTCVGTDTPLDPGVQHKGDYYATFKNLLKEVEVIRALTPKELVDAYDHVLRRRGPVMIVEYRESYSLPHPIHGVE